jgi:hypothetical protein
MRKPITMTIIALLVAAMPALAQHDHGDQNEVQDSRSEGGNENNMMQEDMMKQMHEMQMAHLGKLMDDPVRLSYLKVIMLPGMADKLDYTSDQSDAMAKLLNEYLGQMNLHFNGRSRMLDQLNMLLESDSRDMAGVRSKIGDLAEHDGKLSWLAIKTAIKMEEQLSPDQLAKNDEMTPLELHEHMVGSMSMAEMMQAMHGDGMMMDRGGHSGMMKKMKVMH